MSYKPTTTIPDTEIGRTRTYGGDPVIEVTLPDGTRIKGPKSEIEEYLPTPPVPLNWDGSPKITCKT